MMYRKLKVLGFVLAMLVVMNTAVAQDLASSWNPRTGDAWIDAQLGDINHYGARYREAFVDEMTRYYGAPRELVSDLLRNRHWAPGDVYYACAIAQIIGRPCRYVVDEWDRDHGQGWGVVAQRMGIQPGSTEYHRLKRGFVSTYDRWNRPVVLDDELRRAYPKRGKGAPNDGGNKPAKAGGPDKTHAGKGDASGKSTNKSPGSKGGNKDGAGKDKRNGKG